MASMIEFPLDIPDVRVLKSELSERGDLIITVESALQSATCRRCGRQIQELHGHDTPIRLRHLPALNRRVFIEIRPKRYRCPSCSGGPTSTQKCSWYDPRSPHTKAFEQWMMLQLVNSTVLDVARKNELGYDALEGILQRYVETEVDWAQFESLGCIGLDEIALKKGHKDFAVIVTARMEDETTTLLGVLADRKKKTVVAFLRSIPAHLRSSVNTVCTDMYEGYINAVKEELPGATIVVDRFHVAKAYRDGADTLRKTELRRLKKELPKEEYAKLKGSMWLFRHKAASIKPEAREPLDRLLQHSPALKAAHDLREEMTEIFETAPTKPAAQEAIGKWRDKVRSSGLRCFDAFVTTLGNWMSEITNYFHDRSTSGFVEGLNNKIKVIKRRCYGIFNVSHLFQRITLDLDGYRVFGTS